MSNLKFNWRDYLPRNFLSFIAVSCRSSTRFFQLGWLVTLWLLMAVQCNAQPLAPVNVRVISYANYNRITWMDHPLNPPGYVADYQICRGTSSGATVPVNTVSAPALLFNDNTAGHQYDREFFYTVRAIATDLLVSEHSEEVIRFLPRAGVGHIPMQTSTVTGRQYSNWNPYPGQWTDTYWYVRSSPSGGTNWGAGSYANRKIVRRQVDVEVPPGGPYYIEVRVGRPDWWGTPANIFYTSYSNSLPFYIDGEAPFEDNASSSYFNSSPNRAMADPVVTGGVKTRLFTNHGGGFWRMRQPIRIGDTVDSPANAKINAPCRATININPGEMSAGRATAEVRVADDYGNELPSVVIGETTTGGWVTSFNVHFIASQDFNLFENYWIYWSNPSATPATYNFSNSLSQTSQFEFSPWYSRKIMRGGIESASTSSGYYISSPLPSPADDNYVACNLGFTFPYFDHATNTLHVSTNGYLSFTPHSQPLNNWSDFTGVNGQRFIAPLWCNLMVNGTVPANAGFYYQRRDSGNPRRARGYFTWRANRFNATNEQYVFQAVLYALGDIVFRYDTINFNALWETPSGSGDNPINIAPHHTAGISATDGSRWARITDDSPDSKITPLLDGISRNPVHYFQSCHAWQFAPFTDPTNQPAMAGATTVSHYDSRIFDGRSTDPTWTSLDYEVSGNGSVDLYVRTSATLDFPDWDLAHLVGADLGAGIAAIPLTLPNDRYLQYRVVFKKTNATDDPLLRRIRFSVGYITIDETTNQFNGTDVSQGQTFLASMTFSNFYSNPVNSQVASFVFDPPTALQSFAQLTPHVSNVPFQDSATLGFSVTVDPDSGNLDAWTNIDGYLEAGDGLTTLVSSTAISKSRFRIREKAGLLINSVTAPFDRVNKGQGGIPVTVKISNTSPYVPLIINNTALKFSLGNYSWNPEVAFAPAEMGLFGQYFNTTTANPPTFPEPPVATRVDAEVNFYWGAAAPLPEVGANYFGVRWSGYVIPEFSENYNIYFNADDGVRVWINGEPVINSWIASSFERSANVFLAAGVPAAIVIEYYERTSNARAELRWDSPSQPKQIIPTTRLKPAYFQIVNGGETFTATYTVAVLPDSPSGIAYVNCVASATNAWVSTLETNSYGAATPHTWVIQSPASLAIGLIGAPPLVYRGQANIPVEVEILNLGEADATVASIPLFFTFGSYTSVVAGEVMPTTVNGGSSKKIKVLVSIAEDTATGTSWLDAEVTGADANVGTPLAAAVAAIPGKWTILAEKIITYSDATHYLPAPSFVVPLAGNSKIFVLAENLAPLKEYAIRWFDTSSVELTAFTTIGFSDSSGALAAELEFDGSFALGLYTVKLTNPINTFSPAQTNFSIVTKASLDGALRVPPTVSVGQTFSAYLSLKNDGGAVAEGMVPTALTRSGTGLANYSSGPLPGSIDMSGNSQATFTWNYMAAVPGTFQLSGHSYGYEAVTSALLAVPSGRAGLAAEEYFEEYGVDASVNGGNFGIGWAGGWMGAAGQKIIDINGTMNYTAAVGGQQVKGGLRALSVIGNNELLVSRNLAETIYEPEIYVSMLIRFNGVQGDNKFVALWFETTGYGDAPNIGIKMNRGNGSGVEDFFVRTKFNEQYSSDLVVGQTYFIVGRVSKLFGTGTYDQFELWVNPNNLSSPPAPDAFTTGSSNIAASVAKIGLRSVNLTPGDSVDIAMLRIGKTWDSVVTEPLRSEECVIQIPAQVSIDSLIATPTLVYFDQRNIRVQAALTNHGEAAAKIDLSELLQTPVFGTFTLASPTLPAVLPGNTTATWTFNVNISNPAPIGPATMTCRIRYADLNNPVPTLVDDQEYGWTVIDTRTICSRANTFSSQQYIFDAGQTVYARCTGLPANLSLKIRFYESSFPDPPTGVGVAIPTPLNSGIDGQVDHSYQIPVGTDKLNQWMIVVDDGDDLTLGTIYGTQYFEVVRPALIDYRLSIGSSTCFVGDLVSVDFTVNNLSTWTTNIYHQFRSYLDIASIRRYYGTDLPLFEPIVGSVGSLSEIVSYPARAGGALESGASFTYNFLMRAIEDSGLSGASTSLLLVNSRWYHTNLSTGGNSYQTICNADNSLTIYRKALSLASDTLDFLVVEPGETSETLMSLLKSTGNHWLERVKFGQVDLRKSVSEIIPGSYLQISPQMPLSIATEGSVLLNASLLIPFHQPAGTYVATMAIYEDHNNSGSLDATEPHNLVMAKVEIPSIARARFVVGEVDLGVIAAGNDSNAIELEFVGIGNADLVNLRFNPLPGVTFSPDVYGNMPFNGYGTASVLVTVPASQTPGVYYATGTLLDDSGSFDELGIRWQVGSQSLKVSPGIFALGLGQPTHNLSDYTGGVENIGQLPLEKLLGISTEFINLNQPYQVASDNISLISPAFVDVGSNESSLTHVYVPGGTATGSYLATFTWYEDQNSNLQHDFFEAYDRVPASFTVEEFYRLYSLKPTEDFGSVKPDSSKTLTMGVRNAGSLPVSKLGFIISPLSDGFDNYLPTNITLPSPVLNILPGELRYFDLLAFVPPLHKLGVFAGNMTIYGDLNGNNSFDIGEPSCQLTLQIQIGHLMMEIISPAQVNLVGTPASTTNSVFITVKNTGSLTLTRAMAEAYSLHSVIPGDMIATAAFLYSPTTFLGALVPGQSKTFSIAADIPFAQTPGAYQSTLWLWEDANKDLIRQPAELTRSIPIVLSIAYVKELKTSPAALNLGFFARSDLASTSFLAQNVGNTALEDVRWQISSMLASSSSIPAGNIAILPNPAGTIATPPVGLSFNLVSTFTVNIPTTAGDGIYYGNMIVYENSFDPLANAYNAGLEPSYTMPVQLQVVTPFVNVNPDPIVIPASNPATRTASASFTITNSSLINYRHLKYNQTNLVNGANSISSAHITMSVAALNSLQVGKSQNVEISAMIASFSQAPGTYEGTLNIWDDRNNNNIVDSWETSVPAVVRLVVNSWPAIELYPVSTPIDLGKIARNNFSDIATISLRNIGNVTLTGLSWVKNDMFKDPLNFIPLASISLDLTAVSLLPGASASVAVGIASPMQRIAADQELGVYGDALQLLSTAQGVSDSFSLRCEIIAGGPQGLGPGSVYQEIASTSFPLSPQPAENYILSAYLCPGTGSARLSFLLTDETGIKIEPCHYIEVDATGIIDIQPPGIVAGSDEKIDIYDKNSGETYNYFRVYLAFDYHYDPLVASHSYILLQNTSDLVAGHSVWMDGVQLEKAAGFDRPTSWHDGKKIISPNKSRDLSGKKRYFQW